jgi:tetratricopeptide (TPR) repeat protein
MVGKIPACEQQLGVVLQKDPNNALALFDLATALQSAGRNSEAEEIYRRLANGPASPYQPAYGRYLLRTGKQKEAVAEFERLAKLNPRNVNVRTRLVAAYIATKRMAEAQQLLAATLRKNFKDTAALLQRSELHLMAGANEEARADLNQVLHFTPDSAKAHFLMSRVELATAAPLKQRQELSETLRLDPRFFAARIALAQSYIMAGDGCVLDLMRKTADDQQNTLGFVEYRNWSLLASGDLKELQKGIDEGLAKTHSRSLLLQDALLKLRQGNDAAGRSRLFEILKNNPEDMGAVDVLIRSYAARKQLPVAIEKVRMLIGERPKSAPLQYRLGLLLASNKQPEQARAAYAAAEAANPQFPPARLALAAMDQVQGKPDAARQELDLLLSSKAGELPARTVLGFIEEKAGNYSKAIEHLRKVVEAEPANVIALNNLAYLLADHADQTDEALKYAQKAKELAPNNVTVDGTLGWAYFQKGMYGIALQHLKEAVGREGKNVIDGTAIRSYHLAMAYAKTGDEENASKTLSAALRLDPNLPEARLATQMLESK